MNYFRLYSSFLKKFLRPQKSFKVVFDCSNGTSGIVLQELFLKSKIKNQKSKFMFVLINEKPDGNFPAHGPDPLKPGAVKQLQAAVKKNRADLGIIFDADADRVFFVDDKGRSVDPDAIARLLIWQLKPKKVIIDITTGWLIKKIKNQKSKIKIIESRAGHFFIKKLMRGKKADFGAEHSGHYYFRISDPKLRISSESTNKFELYFDSGILAAIEVINAISELPYKLSDFVDFLPQYYRSEINIRYQASSVKRQEFLKKIEAYYKLQAKSYKLLRISHLDGLTMEFEHPKSAPPSLASAIRKRPSELNKDWWFNLRFSQTEPLLRLNVEAVEKSKLQEQVLKLKKLIDSGGFSLL
jgi:phosphomannomutase